MITVAGSVHPEVLILSDQVSTQAELYHHLNHDGLSYPYRRATPRHIRYGLFPLSVYIFP